MKRSISLILAALLLLSLVSCAAPKIEVPEETAFETTTEEKKEPSVQNQPVKGDIIREEPAGTFEKEGFSVGFGRYKITPSRGTPMAGYGNTESRLSEKTMDDLFITCVAVWDGEKTALFFSVDAISVPTSVYLEACAKIEAELGIPKEYVFMTATHTHSAGVVSVDSVQGGLVIGRALRAAKDAVMTLDSAEMYLGTTKTEKMAYVRRYLKEDGSYIYRDFLPANASEPEYRHETDADNQMQIIRFDRKNQKDVVMVNWTCHVTTVGSLSKNSISADWVGVFREEMEKDGDAYFSFYQGAAGNVTPGTRLVGPKEQNNSKDHVAHGKALAGFCKAALPTLKKTQTGKIRALYSEITCQYLTAEDVAGYNLDHATEISGLFASERGITTKVTQLCRKYGYGSPYHANAVLAASRREEGATAKMNLIAIAIGDVAFAGAPFEMFDTSGMQVKNASEYTMTFMCGYTNGSFGYIPNIEAFPNYQYEVDTCRFEPGTAEQVVAELDRLLKEMR
ncbi:MAG: neutral/alkaline non-lysosomal ceramidase N-terminal domain-containing protein [Clostridia bacterium]|nr:neutral/alkaline non-lysosomal ceramidase N-terminal domain-containing protein [Clostridia bacterium]